jgi:hypothetical protein
LLSVKTGNVIVINAAAEEDIDIVILALLKAASGGKDTSSAQALRLCLPD